MPRKKHTGPSALAHRRTLEGAATWVALSIDKRQGRRIRRRSAWARWL